MLLCINMNSEKTLEEQNPELKCISKFVPDKVKGSNSVIKNRIPHGKIKKASIILLTHHLLLSAPNLHFLFILSFGGFPSCIHLSLRMIYQLHSISWKLLVIGLLTTLLHRCLALTENIAFF